MSQCNREQIPVVILCGGYGTRLGADSHQPKPLFEIDGKPMVYHVINHYKRFGFNRFILCLGFGAAQIRKYFSDLDWDIHIQLVDTGEQTQTGARLKRIENLIDTDVFAVTYVDGFSNLDISKELEFHLAHQKVATLAGVVPPPRFGELKIEGDSVVGFIEKPLPVQSYLPEQSRINGGFFFFNKLIFKYLSAKEDCVLENGPLSRLAQDGQLHVYKHDGYWQCVDTPQDLNMLKACWGQW